MEGFYAMTRDDFRHMLATCLKDEPDHQLFIADQLRRLVDNSRKSERSESVVTDSELKEKMGRLEEENQSLKDRIKTLNNLISRQHEAMRKWANEANERRQMVDDALKNVDRLQKECDSLVAERDAFRDHVSQLKMSLNETTLSSVHALESENNNLKIFIQKTKESTDYWANKSHKYQSVVNYLTSRLEETLALSKKELDSPDAS
jgi:chromosome segregation ATPase